jgi:DNA-binding protein H-NS
VELGAGKLEDTKQTMNRNWEELSLEELWTLHEELSDTLATRITSQKRELEHRLEQLNRQKVSSPSLRSQSPKTPTSPARRKYPKVLPKYQNPKAPGETWSGRGKRPRWLVSALKAGGRLEEFELGRRG